MKVQPGKMSIRAVAQTLGMSPTTVLKLSRQANSPDENGMIFVGTCVGLDGKIRPSRRFDTTDRDERIRELRDAGQTVRAIAADVGCSVGTVHRIIRGACTDE